MDKLTLPNGQLTALASVNLTRSVNDSEDLSLGSACAAMLEFTAYGDTPEVAQGMELSYSHKGEDLGLFTCEKPRQTGKNTYKVTAYDRMVRFDRDVSAVLEATPCTLGQLLTRLCAYCGVPLGEEPLPGETYLVERFTARGLTGRRLLNYIGQVAGRFFYIDPAGVLRPGWYTPAAETLGEEIPIRMGSLTYAAYTTAPIERVLIRASANDAGVVWPDGSEATANTMIIEGNPLLAATQSAQLLPVAQRLYEQLKAVTYTPFSCTLAAGYVAEPGKLYRFGDGLTGLVMEQRLRSGGCAVAGTGNPSLQSTTAFNRLSLGELGGRLLTVEKGMDGLRVEHTDLAMGLASVELTLDGIATRVTAVEEGDVTALTELRQQADGLRFSVSQLRTQTDAKADRSELLELTEHFRFGAEGMTISNTATGMGIGVSEKRIAFTGGGTPTTQITPNEMTTTNLHIGSRLDLGSFSLLPRTSGNLSLRYTQT